MVPHPLFAQAALEYINISFDTFSSIAFLIAFFTRLTNLLLDKLFLVSMLCLVKNLPHFFFTSDVFSTFRLVSFQLFHFSLVKTFVIRFANFSCSSSVNCSLDILET